MEPRTLEQAKITKGKLCIYNFDYESIIGRSDGLMIDLENCDRFQTLVLIYMFFKGLGVQIMPRHPAG